MRRNQIAALVTSLLACLMAASAAKAQWYSMCPNGICEPPYEDPFTCPMDCGGGGDGGGYCGDQYCDWVYGGENPQNCWNDCGCVYPLVCFCPGAICVQVCFEVHCGDGECVEFEDAYNCPQDCHTPICSVCGDGICTSPTEDGVSCPADCCPDHDGDGLTSCDEAAAGTSDDNADTDGDGVGDYAELVTYGTDPLNWDSDGDLLPDRYELDNTGREQGALDPLNALDASADSDGDGNSNLDEYWNGTDAWNPDPVPNPLIPGGPGAYYWGDGDGDGLSMIGDRSMMQCKAAGLPVTFNNVIPNNGDGLDLDGDGLVMFGDLTILRGFILNTSVGIVGSRAASLEKVYEPLSPVAVGGTAHVTVRVRNEGGVTNHYSAGFSVLFSIDPSSTGAAVLLGGDGAYGAGTRFDVSGPSGSSDGGHATMHLKITSPGAIIVNATIPACGVHGIGKWVDEITLDPAFTITAGGP